MANEVLAKIIEIERPDFEGDVHVDFGNDHGAYFSVQSARRLIAALQWAIRPVRQKARGKRP